jgi:hypothetical protein
LGAFVEQTVAVAVAEAETETESESVVEVVVGKLAFACS